MKTRTIEASGIVPGDTPREQQQPHLCDECLHHAHKRAELVEQISWATSYCPHNETLAIYLCEKRSIVRWQLNGPVSESDAQAQVDAVVAEQHRQQGAADSTRVQ